MSAFERAGVVMPPAKLLGRSNAIDNVFQRNKPLQTAMSEYIRRERPTLKRFVELIRGQTVDDYRPNKALSPAVLRHQCRGYEHLTDLVRVASEGVRLQLKEPLPRQFRFPRNHPSASARIKVLRKSIRKEQDLFRCIVVDADIMDIWPEPFVSPYGVVDKGDGDPDISGRVIHDLWFPEGASVNYFTDRAGVPNPTYEHCSSVAREILRCQQADAEREVKVMAGDVAAAYRNACIHSECVHMFAGYIPEANAIVIDMSASFGWTGSAGIYSILGALSRSYTAEALMRLTPPVSSTTTGSTATLMSQLTLGRAAPTSSDRFVLL